MKSKFLIIIVLLAFSFTDTNFTYNGNFSHFYALRNSNNKVLNIPFRMLELNTTLRISDNFEIKSFLSSEYHNTNDDYFNLKNINNEIRELYGTYYFNLGEISFGKKLYTLGSVDENSPIDHFNPYNYYYLLMGGIDKKISINAISFELYLENDWNNISPFFSALFPPLGLLINGDFKLSGAYSPYHNTNYYPENDSEYELSLPISPSEYDLLPIKGSPHESYLSINKSNLNSDFTLTYSRAYDRVFSLSGFMTFNNDIATNPITENKFTYRLTETLNIGSIFLLDDMTIRSDFAIFHSFDRNNINDYMDILSKIDMIFCEINCYDPPFYQVYEGTLNDVDDVPFRLPLNEDAYYSQINIQIELPLPNNWQVNMQFFKYNLDKYKSISYLTDDINLPMAQIAAGGLFIPGYGSSMATLSQKSLFLSVEKFMLDNNLKSTLTSFFDLDKGNGKLLSFELEYEILDNMNLVFGSTKIMGDSSIQSENDYDPGYTFNLMKDFSHNRIQINYYF